MQPRVLLIYPPSRTQAHSSCPTGLTMVGAVLERAGCEVHLLDANSTLNRRTSEQIIAFAQQLKPDVIGITLVTPLARTAYRLAAGLRSTGAKLLAGGPHATILPEEPLLNGFDVTVIGEGEPTAAEAVDALLGNVDPEAVEGLAYRASSGELRRTAPRPPVADLDTLPPPALHLVNSADYGGTASGLLYGNLFSSRGCPARCSYCAGSLFGKQFRFRSAKSMVDEISERHERYGATHFHFMDDSMTANRERVLEICEGLKHRVPDVTWSMMTRVDFVDEELVTAASKAGCIEIDFGIESGHPDTLKKIRKPHSVGMVRRVIPMTAAKGIKPVVFFILGFPWDTPQSLDVTWNVMRELAPYVEFHPAVASVLIPFPGTQLYETYKDEYHLNEWWLSSERNYDAPDLSRHAYFETQLFSRGSVLDADFFRYSSEVRDKITDMFMFMWRHGLQQESWPTRLRAMALVETSRKLDAFSPSLERFLFAQLRKLRHVVS